MTASPETKTQRHATTFAKQRDMKIRKDGRLFRPTKQEIDMPTNYMRPFTGCWLYVINKGKKEWCQRGAGESHKGVGHSV